MNKDKKILQNGIPFVELTGAESDIVFVPLFEFNKCVMRYPKYEEGNTKIILTNSIVFVKENPEEIMMVISRVRTEWEKVNEPEETK